MRADNENRHVAVAGSIKPQVNRYYLRVSRRYMTLGIFALIVLIVYIVGVMSVFGDYVTYDNLKYLSKDFSVISLTGDAKFSRVVYNGRDKMNFEYFRGGVALCNGDNLTYYDPSGICLIDEKIGYSEPMIVGGEKYMLVYDLGGHGYSIYNQLTKIISREAEGRIIAGDIATDGSSIIVTRSRETKYVASVYSSSFNKSMDIYKDNYVLDAAISPDGKRYIICSAIPSDTDFSCEIDILMAGKSESVRTLTYEHTMPLQVRATEDGFVLLCDRGVYFYDYEGKSAGSYTFDGMSLRFADISEKTVVIAGSTNTLGTEHRIIVLTMSGEKIYDEIALSRVTAVYASRDTKSAMAYVKAANRVVLIDADGNRVTMKSDSVGDVISVVPVKDGAIICRKTSAVFAEAGDDFSDISESETDK